MKRGVPPLPPAPLGKMVFKRSCPLRKISSRSGGWLPPPPLPPRGGWPHGPPLPLFPPPPHGPPPPPLWLLQGINRPLYRFCAACGAHLCQDTNKLEAFAKHFFAQNKLPVLADEMSHPPWPCECFGLNVKLPPYWRCDAASFPVPVMAAGRARDRHRGEPEAPQVERSRSTSVAARWPD